MPIYVWSLAKVCTMRVASSRSPRLSSPAALNIQNLFWWRAPSKRNFRQTLFVFCLSIERFVWLRFVVWTFLPVLVEKPFASCESLKSLRIRHCATPANLRAPLNVHRAGQKLIANRWTLDGKRTVCTSSVFNLKKFGCLEDAEGFKLSYRFINSKVLQIQRV